MEENKNFHIELLDQNKLIKNNDIKKVSNPITFTPGNGFTSDGLLSNEIFGITKEERAGICGYIDLEEKFIQPYLYKIWLKVDRNLRGIVYETKKYSIKNGYLIEDENGGTGIKFLMKHIDELKFKDTKKDSLLSVLMSSKQRMFTDKLVVIPPYYRDANTGRDGRLGVGEINKLYVSLLNAVKSLRESNDYGLTLAGGIRGRIQDLMLEIYNWYTMGESVIGGEHTGAGIFKKFGLMRRSVLSKTTDNSARLVISSANINVNKTSDLMVDMNYSAIPLSAVCVISAPFMIYNLRQYFLNQFGGKTTIYDGFTNTYVELDNPLIEFSDDRFEKEMNEFIHSYSNRFKPLEIPIIKEDGKRSTMRSRFKSYSISKEEYDKGVRELGSNGLIERDITWLDILYKCADESVDGKVALITRYPMDSYFNQLYTMIHISSTIETEPMVINGKFYRWYPKIRQEDIGKDTSNMFIDTASFANPYCKAMGADFDGDQITVKMANSVEANQELRAYMDSKAQLVNLSGINARFVDHEAYQVLYNLTKTDPDTKNLLTKNIEF